MSRRVCKEHGIRMIEVSCGFVCFECNGRIIRAEMTMTGEEWTRSAYPVAQRIHPKAIWWVIPGKPGLWLWGEWESPTAMAEIEADDKFKAIASVRNAGLRLAIFNRDVESEHWFVHGLSLATENGDDDGDGTEPVAAGAKEGDRE